MRVGFIVIAIAQILAALPAHAQSEIVAYKAFMAKLSISRWGAMPIFIDTRADVGTMYLLQHLAQEQPSARGERCYLDRYLEEPQEEPSIVLQNGVGFAASAKLGIPLRQYMADVGLSGSYDSSTDTLFRLDGVRIDGPWSDWPLSDIDNIGQDPACGKLKENISGAVDGLLAFRTVTASLRIERFLESREAANVSASIAKGRSKLGEAKAEVIQSTASYLLIEGEQTVIAIQPQKLDPGRVTEIYAFFNERPETYAELRMLVDNYLAGTGPGFWDRRRAEILGWLEKNWWADHTLEDFERELFASDRARPRSEVEEKIQALEPRAFEAAGYLGAALVIGSAG